MCFAIFGMTAKSAAPAAAATGAAAKKRTSAGAPADGSQRLSHASWHGAASAPMMRPARAGGRLSAASLASRAASAERARELLAKVGLSDRMDHLPAELSGGERQRVALARALVTDPGLVLADEPTGNLDAMTGADILRILAELSRGGKTALVMVTHSPDAAAVCDRTLSLENGVLVAK